MYRHVLALSCQLRFELRFWHPGSSIDWRGRTSTWSSADQTHWHGVVRRVQNDWLERCRIRRGFRISALDPGTGIYTSVVSFPLSCRVLTQMFGNGLLGRKLPVHSIRFIRISLIPHFSLLLLPLFILLILDRLCCSMVLGQRLPSFRCGCREVAFGRDERVRRAEIKVRRREGRRVGRWGGNEGQRGFEMGGPREKGEVIE